MNEKLPFTLSKATEKTRAEVSGLKRELAEMQAAADALLDDDTAAPEVLAKRLEGVRAKRDILEARLGRRRADLLAGIVADARQAHAQCEKNMAAARVQRKTVKEEWLGDLKKAAYKPSAVQRMRTCPGEWPKALRDCERALDEIGSKMTELALLRKAIDPALNPPGPNLLAGHEAAKNYMLEASKYLSELA